MGFSFRRHIFTLCLSSLLVAGWVFAQGGGMTGRLAGVVRDQLDAVIPGAQITAKNTATGAVYEAVSNEEGSWVIPSLQNGTYTVSISLPGFRTTVVENVRVEVGDIATVNAKLEVGGIDETVTVTGGATVLKTESANIASTIVGRQIVELPFTTRDALQLVLTLPGVQTPGTPRTSSVMGLPKATLNIMIDGANVQDNYLKSSDGFFTSIQAKSDAVEEVTVSTATPGAESAAGGAVQFKFVTKSGSNEFHGGAFWQRRDDRFNANWYINTLDQLPRDKIRMTQMGGRLGGPIMIPGIFNGRDKAFFFVNYENFDLPQTYNVSRTVITEKARQGIFTYMDTTGVLRDINLYALAGAKGYPSTPDPTILKAEELIAGAVTKTGTLTSRVGTQQDYNRLDYVFQDPGTNIRKFPTARLDFQITKNHHFEFVHNYQHYYSIPDGVNGIYSRYPGLGTHVGSPTVMGGSVYRNSFSFVAAERWTVTNRLVNEVRFASSGNGTVVFRREFSPTSFALFGGYAVSDPYASGFYTYSSSSRRNTPVKNLEENLSWMKGTHTLNFGFSFTQINAFNQSVSSHLVPTITLGYATNDPIVTGSTNIFTTTNFPNSTSAQRSQAQSLYALLTGRISATGRSSTLSEITRKYEFIPYTERNHQREFGFYGQDSWKIRPNLTLNYGLRWELSPSPVNDNQVYTRTGGDAIFGVSGPGNLFKPGVFKGGLVQYRLLAKGEKAYKTNYKDFAPTFGFAWTPKLDMGFLRYVFGDPGQSVLRGGYSIAYVREGFATFNSMFGSNEGPTYEAGTNPTLYPDVFGPPGSRLFRDGSYPFLPLPEAKFPMTARQNASLNDFNPNLRTGYVQSWTFGLQRELTKNLALEVRYVANHGTRLWRQYEIGEVNIFENGFLEEFKIAQENLRIARTVNPSSNNFGNQGLPGQKNIPIISTGLGFTNDLTTAITLTRGEAGRLAANIAQTVTRMNNLINAGLVPYVTIQDPNDPAKIWKLSNWFVANPQAPTSSYYMDNGGDSNYHSLQVEVNRRMARGLLFQGSYVFAKGLTSMYANSSSAFAGATTMRDFGYDKGPAPRDMRHALKMNWINELPFGPGRRFLNGGPAFVRKLLEGWQWTGVARIQSGTPLLITGGRLTFNNQDAGVVLHNMDGRQLQKMVKIRKTTDPVSQKGVIYWLPKDVIDNTLAAFEVAGKTPDMVDKSKPYIGPPTTPGVMGYKVFVYGPWTQRWDLSVMKRTYITEGTNIEFRANFLNAFNQSSITLQDPGTNAASGSIGSTFGQTRNAYRDFTVSGTNDPGGRLIEFQLRFNF